MKVLGWLKALLSVVIAAAIGLAVTGVVNLLHPAEHIGWAIAAVLVASVLSALAAFLVTTPRKKTPAPAAVKQPEAGAKKS
jgi:ABC-type uncharacterized transport system permease subunit